MMNMDHACQIGIVHNELDWRQDDWDRAWHLPCRGDGIEIGDMGGDSVCKKTSAKRLCAEGLIGEDPRWKVKYGQEI